MNLSQESLQPARLIVLLPESLAGDSNFAKRIYALAVRDRRDVLYLTLLEKHDNILTTSRRIATTKAVTESDTVHVGCTQVPTGRWLQKLNEILRPDDTIVCHDLQYVRQGVFKSLPISEFLKTAVSNEIVLVRGYYKPQKVIVMEWVRSTVFWLGSLGILGGFSLLELQVTASMKGVSNKLALAGMLALEFGAVWIWNRINHNA